MPHRTHGWDRSPKPTSIVLMDVPGVGAQPLAWVIAQWIIGHMHDETGEISAIKGVADLVGYPEG